MDGGDTRCGECKVRGYCVLPSPGVGKSFLAEALGYQAIKMGFLVYYRSIFDLVRDFLADEAFAGADRLLAKYLKPDLLIVDDIGIKQLPRKSGEYPPTFYENTVAVKTESSQLGS